MTTEIRVLAVASGGGHWIQLFRLRPAWDGCAVTYVTTNVGYRDEVMRDAAERGQPAPVLLAIVDASRWQKLRLIRLLFQLLICFIRVRPHRVITTGAAPGFFAILFGRLFGARSVWVDSIANTDELSESGQRAGPLADYWLTQWEHLARPDGAEYLGKVV